MNRVRSANWDVELVNYLTDAPRFEWGVSDCALFAANWVRLATGQDFANGVRGRYTTAKGALRILAREGRTLADMVDQCLTRRDACDMPQRGDVCGVRGGAGAFDVALGICDGLHVRLYDQEGRLAALPISHTAMSWIV